MSPAESLHLHSASDLHHPDLGSTAVGDYQDEWKRISDMVERTFPHVLFTMSSLSHEIGEGHTIVSIQQEEVERLSALLPDTIRVEPLSSEEYARLSQDRVNKQSKAA